MINIITKDVIEKRKQEYIKNIKIKYNELGRVPKFSEVERDNRFLYIHSYINSYDKWSDLVYEALDICNSKIRKFPDKSKDELIELLKQELTRMKNQNLKYSCQTYFDKNRRKDILCSNTYQDLLNKDWKEIVKYFGF